MTKFENPSFSVFPGSNKNYRDNYDRIFGKKDKSDAYADERTAAPKSMSDLPPPRDAQPAPEVKKQKKPRKKKPKNEKAKKKQKAK